jgi:ligand-binding sensor domain-containing protein/signal transduction histidine kinase
MIRQFTLYFLLLPGSILFSQKYNFVNWTVEDGLIQSQASFICQDSYRQLWIGSEGGISRFDGKKFTSYTVQDGLASNHINTMFCDKTGNMWTGTNYGISVYNGRRFKTMKPLPVPVNNVENIVEGSDGWIYLTDNFNLLRTRDGKMEKILVTGDSSEKVTSLIAENGQLLASVYQKGIYCSDKQNGAWQAICTLPEDLKKLFIRELYISSKNDTLLATTIGLYRLSNKNIVPYRSGTQSFPAINVLCIAEDAKQDIWLGTDNGVYKADNNQFVHFDEKNGFTDNSVRHIYKDVENNLWFASNADGIFKFRENTFTYYDKSSGLSNPIVMGVTQTGDGTIYAGGYGGGLYRINSKNGIEPVKDKVPVLTDTKIYCLHADDKNNVWIGTLNNGIWKYNERTGLKRLEAKNNPDLSIPGVNVFFTDRRGNLLIGTNYGLFLKDGNDNIIRLKISGNSITDLKQFDNECVLVSTSKGIYLLDKEYNSEPFNEKDFGNSSVLCIAKNNDNIWLGTTDNGVLNWNIKTGKIITYTTADGLPSNFIYSIYVSDKYKAWIGTGFGISNLQLDNSGKLLAIKNYGRSDGLLGMECNHNSLLKARDSSLWFGTTKGLFHFNPNTNITEKNQPLVLLRSVRLFSSEITDSSLFKNPGTWFRVPEQLKLGSKQNHLTFELGSIYFTNPEDILFKYKLEGIDKDFTTTYNPYIVYPALPPGKYTLNVIGVTKSGVLSSNEINYSFEIEKAFYQTRFFQVVVILLLLGTGALLAYVFTRGKQKRKQKAKELLEKIREEEFMKLRQRTAEDFHDEMGNNLTRISVLTDVLKSKINGKEKEVTKLVEQIKENTTSLYKGSRDIIWSLNSKNDGMFEIAEHIRDIGNELFQETRIDFAYAHNVDPHSSLKLKLDYSRNLTMIFKEAYSNILKHSGADKVEIILELKNDDYLEILIRDNGNGFNAGLVGGGNGMRNMRTRAGRMNGTMTVISELKKGTEINILLKNIFI